MPRIEDLTADSDLVAFLRKGVPDALRNAALRRMWSLDPSIGAFSQLAEYAYDFNDPASIPGFGVATTALQLAAPLSARVPEHGPSESASRTSMDRMRARAGAGDTPELAETPRGTEVAATVAETPASAAGQALTPALPTTSVDSAVVNPGPLGSDRPAVGEPTAVEPVRSPDGQARTGASPRHGSAMPR